MEKEEKAAGRRGELRGELKSLGLLGRAVSEFGLEYLKSEDSPRAPHPMSELERRIEGMGLTKRELLRMGNKSYDHIGPFTDFPFSFNAENFAGDKDGLVSIRDMSMDDYVEEALKGGDDDGFIDWLDREGLVGEGWAARADPPKRTTLSLSGEEARALLLIVDEAIGKTKEEVKLCGRAGARARQLLPKYHGVSTLLGEALKSVDTE